MSSWSGPAQWSMGLLDRSDWGAKWIWDPAVAVSPKVEEEAAGRLNYGYHSKSVKTADTEIWAVLDLGHEQEFDAVKLSIGPSSLRERSDRWEETEGRLL